MQVDLGGWYSDPYARHAARWFSNGNPTKLVRDGGVTSYDDPPAGPYVNSREELDSEPITSGGNDLLRADAAECGDQYDAKNARLAQLDELGAMGPQPF